MPTSRTFLVAPQGQMERSHNKPSGTGATPMGPSPRSHIYPRIHTALRPLLNAKDIEKNFMAESSSEDGNYKKEYQQAHST